jgi:hypothetical protein
VVLCYKWLSRKYIGSSNEGKMSAVGGDPSILQKVRAEKINFRALENSN